MFGLHMVRALLPYLQYLLGDRLGLGSVQLGLVALILFASAFLAGWLNRQMGLRGMLLVTAGGVGLTRLLVQFWTGDPIVDMILVAVGTVLFILFLPAQLALTYWHGHQPESGRRFAQAILLGLMFDTGLHGVFLTYDFIWQAGTIPLGLAAGLVLLQWLALWLVRPVIPAHPIPIEASFRDTLPWLAIGPFFFLQLLVFQNQAQLTTLTGWSLPVVFGWIVLSQLLALWAAGLWHPRRIGAAAWAALLIITLWPFGRMNPAGFAIMLLLGQVAAAVLLGTVLRGVGTRAAEIYYTIGTPQQPQEGIKNTAIVHGLSMVLLVILVFAYYVGFSLPVPYQNSWLLTLAGLIIGLCGIGAVSALAGPALTQQLQPTLLLALGMLFFPLLSYLTRHAPNTFSPTEPAETIRVMTYNVHNGFNTNGHLDLEALAQLIEAEQPDIVALQEVSRGWVVNGSVDMVSWFRQRLGMAYAFGPSSDVLWGQAIFSRYPIEAVETYPLPPRTIPLKRSFIYIRVDSGRPNPLQLINAHLHHPVDAGEMRLIQVETMLNFLEDKPAAEIIITGDLNATPDTPEIEQLYQHGFNDVVIEAKLIPGYTFISTGPFKRLDYVLISPGLGAANVVIPNSTASDHLGIATTIQFGH